MTADDIDNGLPRLPMFDGNKQPQHLPAPTKLTLTAYRDRAARVEKVSAGAEEIRALALRLGADDVGLVSVDREDLAAQRADRFATSRPSSAAFRSRRRSAPAVPQVLYRRACPC